MATLKGSALFITTANFDALSPTRLLCGMSPGRAACGQTAKPMVSQATPTDRVHSTHFALTSVNSTARSVVRAGALSRMIEHRPYNRQFAQQSQAPREVIARGSTLRDNKQARLHMTRKRQCIVGQQHWWQIKDHDAVGVSRAQLLN